MRNSSQILIYLNVSLALQVGLRLMISANEVVLCAGDERGFIIPQLFGRVEWAGNRQALPGWERPPTLETNNRDQRQGEQLHNEISSE